MEHRSCVVRNVKIEFEKYRSTGGGAPVTDILTISHPFTQRNIVSLAGADAGTVDTSSHTSEGAMT